MSPVEEISSLMPRISLGGFVVAFAGDDHTLDRELRQGPRL